MKITSGYFSFTPVCDRIYFPPVELLDIHTLLTGKYRRAAR